MQKIYSLTSAQTIAKYKNLRCYYAMTLLTFAQTQKLIAFCNSVLVNNPLNWSKYALANLQTQINAVANTATLNANQYNNLLLKHDTLEREQLNALLYKQHKALYKKVHTNLAVSLIDMY